MSRFRRIIVRFSRLAGPGLLLVATICMAGLGFHAARDWHHHGEIRAGIFHLHFHVGHHEHADHHHPEPADHNHDAPDNEPPSRTAVFSLAQAVHDNPSVASSPGPPEQAPEHPPIATTIVPPNNDPYYPVNPRAPPV